MRSDGGTLEDVEELGDEGGGGAGSGGKDLSGKGDGAEVWIGDGVLDGLGWSGCRPGVREVDGGDLQAVEEKTGAPGIELVRREAMEDLADGDLDGASVLGVGKSKGRGAVLALREVDGLGGCAGRAATAGVVVVEAEVFAAEARAAAAVTVGEDVAALEAALRGGRWRRLELDAGHARYPSPRVLRG